MRCSIGVIVVMISAFLASSSVLEAGQPTRSVQPAPAQQSSSIPVTADQQRRAAIAQQTAVAEEKKVALRVRWVEQQMQREETLLAQRLAYANKLRQNGLTKNDQKILDQASQYERQALAAYQSRVEQFEKVLQSTGTTTSAQPANSTTRAPSKNRKTTPTRARSTRKPHPNSRLIRRR